MTFFNPSRACLKVKVLIRIFPLKPSFTKATHATSLKTSFQEPFWKKSVMDLYQFGAKSVNAILHIWLCPKLCHDERFLNSWVKTSSVTFDRITDLSRMLILTTINQNWMTGVVMTTSLRVKIAERVLGCIGKLYLSVIPFFLFRAQAPMYATLLVLGLHTSSDLKTFHYPNTLMTTM